MASQSFSLDPSLAKLPLSLLRKRYEDMTPAERIAAGLVRPASQDEFDSAMGSQGGGAPADFSGRVLPNPNNVQVSDDTDSGIPALRLPNGVSAVTGAYNGTPKLDIANPASAQVIPAAMQTIGANTSGAPPQTLPAEFSQWDKAPTTLPADFDKWDAQPAPNSESSNDNPTFGPQDARGKEFGDTLEREVSAAGHTIVGIPSAVWHSFVDPETAEEKTSREQKEAAGTTQPNDHISRGIQRLAGVVGIDNAIDYYKKYFHATPDQKILMQSDMLSVAPEAIGAGGGAAVAGKLIEKVPDAVKAAPDLLEAAKDLPSTAKANVKPALRNTGTTLKTVGKSLDPDLVGIWSPRAANVLRLANKVGKVATKLGAEAAPEVAAKASTATAPIERDATLDTRNIPEYAGEEETETAPPQKKTLADLAKPPDTSPKNVSRLLKQATGAQEVKVVPGVKIKNQPAAAGVKLPEGFTPTQSSVLKGYQYNPATQELDGITNTGGRYRHAQVSSEQFAQFEKDAADSPGKAWNNLRNAPGVTPLGKVDAVGKLQPRIKPQGMRSAEVDPETGEPEFSDVLEQKKKNLSDFIKPSAPEVKAAAKNAAPAAEPDLGSTMQQMLDQVKSGKTLKDLKGGVETTVDPGDLTKRWGVDEKSIADTDANVRGMTEAESKAYINKLSRSYKKGTQPDPVIEVRDANNNIISVDGRHRALAAKKAGIERIPVIVRRAVTQ